MCYVDIRPRLNLVVDFAARGVVMGESWWRDGVGVPGRFVGAPLDHPCCACAHAVRAAPRRLHGVGPQAAAARVVGLRVEEVDRACGVPGRTAAACPEGGLGHPRRPPARPPSPASPRPAPPPTPPHPTPPHPTPPHPTPPPLRAQGRRQRPPPRLHAAARVGLHRGGGRPVRAAARLPGAVRGVLHRLRLGWRGGPPAGQQGAGWSVVD